MAAAKVISFINYKGGVGKTTTTYHIGCALAQFHEKRVLLIDIDPQTNLSFLCAPFEKWFAFKKNNGTVADVYRRFRKRESLQTKKYIWHAPVNPPSGRIRNVDLIPCDVDLLGEDLGGGQIAGTFPTMEALRQNSKEYLRERSFLRNVVQDVAPEYDYILIDCPPNLYLMTQSALLASDWYVITAIPDHLSTIGLRILQDKVATIGQNVQAAQTFVGLSGPPSVARIGGVIFVKVRIGGTVIANTHQDIMGKVAQLLGAQACFKTHTTELIGYGEAAEASVPVWEHTTSRARYAARKGEYRRIAVEFVRRF